ncbi:amino acid permease [Saccharopolyspora erythraea]|uniref:amino acid permease n=1 Tax=Saccharopolyspora erythraea TaxID=1836 RepID=UPI001BA97223|nr:amino acid permease [Saccharopolyspora erythraea]QUG99577.1 amino acid permease [Saccharopolyspora erythraea]
MPGNGLLRTKSIEQSIRDTDEPNSKLKKSLGAFDLTVFGVAVVVGAGIFSVAASTAGNMAGPSVSLAFIMAAVTCGLAALCYAEFASTVPVAGSAYTFSYATFGELIAWIIGWDLVLEFAVAASVISKSWSSYLAEVLGLAGADLSPVTTVGPVTVDWGAMFIAGLITVLLVAGTKLSSRVNQVITAIKVTVVLVVIVVGIGYVDSGNYTPFIPPAAPSAGADAGATGLDQSLLSVLFGGAGSTYGMFGLLAAASTVFFAFIGFDIVATAAEETRDPKRDMPRGILGSLVIVTVLYVAVSLVVTGMSHYTTLKDRPDGSSATLATAFADHGVTWVAGFISVAAMIGLMTVVMVLIMGQSRVLFAMSRDGLLPKAASKTSERGTPARATAFVGVVVALVSGLFDTNVLAELVNVGTLFAFAMVSVGVIVLRRTRPDLERGFRTPFVPVVPVLAVLACLWLMINLTVFTWVWFFIWLVLGLAVYFAYGRRHSVLGRRLVEAGREEQPARAR